MRALNIVLSFALILGTCLCAVAQVSGTTTPDSTAATALARPKSPNLQIVSPQAGQRISTDFVNIQYQVTSPAGGANNPPTFQVSLDGADPVETASNTQTLSGLALGAHTVSVQMVDANGLPVSGTRTEVRFVVASPQADPATARTPGGSGEAQSQPGVSVVNVTLNPESAAPTPAVESPQQNAPPQSATQQGDNNLPSTGSALPLLSVIGFGVLVGGIASALKTR